MRDNQKLIDDVMTLGGNVLGNLLGARHEWRAQVKQHMESVTRNLDLVGRSEFDAAFAMLAKARAMQEDLNDRITAIEAHLNLSSVSKPKKAMKANLPSVKKGNQRRKRS
jgi:BMFP domain-containing protein YqiC